jgi:hypothetical protein
MSVAVSQERLDHDRALLRRLADGEGAALEVLYRRYGVEVYRHALRFRNNAAMAADATAHAFKRLMPDMSALMAPGQDVLSWLQQEAVQAEESWGVQGADDVADIGQAMPPTELGPSLLAHFYAARHRALPSSLRVTQQHSCTNPFHLGEGLDVDPPACGRPHGGPPPAHRT